ncbi:hypothetical protein ABEF95_010759 [Exophiala dermatitidis]
MEDDPTSSSTLPPALVNPFYPALEVGAAAGAAGVAYGGIASVLIQSPRPTVYTTLSGLQWFCGGSTFFYCRSALLAGPLSRNGDLDRVAASGIAGSCAGVLSAAFLPRGSIIPGGITMGVLAAITQAGLNRLDGSSPASRFSSGLKQKLVGLIPMKSLSDEEYENLLQDKLLKLEAEISLLDDQIANLRAASKQANAVQEKPTNAKS